MYCRLDIQGNVIWFPVETGSSLLRWVHVDRFWGSPKTPVQRWYNSRHEVDLSPHWIIRLRKSKPNLHCPYAFMACTASRPNHFEQYVCGIINNDAKWRTVCYYDTHYMQLGTSKLQHYEPSQLLVPIQQIQCVTARGSTLSLMMLLPQMCSVAPPALTGSTCTVCWSFGRCLFPHNE